MKYSLGLLTGLLCLGLAPVAFAQQVSQTDITGVNVWNQIPPLFDLDAPDIEALLTEIETFNASAETAYGDCTNALAIIKSGPRRYARPDSPNAVQELPLACGELEELRPEGDRLRQEVAELEAKYADPDLLTW